MVSAYSQFGLAWFDVCLLHPFCCELTQLQVPDPTHPKINNQKPHSLAWCFCMILFSSSERLSISFSNLGKQLRCFFWHQLKHRKLWPLHVFLFFQKTWLPKVVSGLNIETRNLPTTPDPQVFPKRKNQWPGAEMQTSKGLQARATHTKQARLHTTQTRTKEIVFDFFYRFYRSKKPLYTTFPFVVYSDTMLIS